MLCVGCQKEVDSRVKFKAGVPVCKVFFLYQNVVNYLQHCEDKVMQLQSCYPNLPDSSGIGWLKSADEANRLHVIELARKGSPKLTIGEAFDRSILECAHVRVMSLAPASTL